MQSRQEGSPQLETTSTGRPPAANQAVSSAQFRLMRAFVVVVSTGVVASMCRTYLAGVTETEHRAPSAQHRV